MLKRCFQMRRGLAIALLAGLIAAAGCRRKQEPPASPTPEPKSVEQLGQERMADPVYMRELSEKGAAARAARKASVEARRKLLQIESRVKATLSPNATPAEVQAACAKDPDWQAQKKVCDQRKAESLQRQRETAACVGERIRRQHPVGIRTNRTVVAPRPIDKALASNIQARARHMRRTAAEARLAPATNNLASPAPGN